MLKRQYISSISVYTHICVALAIVVNSFASSVKYPSGSREREIYSAQFLFYFKLVNVKIIQRL